MHIFVVEQQDKPDTAITLHASQLSQYNYYSIKSTTLAQ